MAFGSYCSPPEYHMRYSLRSASYSTCGHMTATFSHGWSAVSTGFSPIRSQVLPSALVAYPIEDLPSNWPVYHMWYRSPSRITTGRLTSASQPDALRGPRTICGSPQVTPSWLSTRAILCFGRQENHMRYRLSSRSTEMSKQVPSLPPRTGFFSYFCHPAAVSVSPLPFSPAVMKLASSAMVGAHKPRIGRIRIKLRPRQEVVPHRTCSP